MFRCIGRPREIAHEKDEEGGTRESGPLSRKGAVKRLTKQMRDMTLKFLGANRKTKPIMEKKGHTDFDCTTGGVPIANPNESSISTPTRDFTSSTYLDGRSDPRSSIGASEEGDIIFEDKDIVTEEWIAEVEHGVYVTFVSFPHGANHLKRIHFSPVVTTELQAKMWWAENYERILKLYKVQRYSEHALDISPTYEDEGGYYDYYPSEHLGQSGGPHFHAGFSMEPSMTTTTSYRNNILLAMTVK